LARLGAAEKRRWCGRDPDGAVVLNADDLGCRHDRESRARVCYSHGAPTCGRSGEDDGEACGCPGAARGGRPALAGRHNVVNALARRLGPALGSPWQIAAAWAAPAGPALRGAWGGAQSWTTYNASPG
jgi:hypothetical protein